MMIKLSDHLYIEPMGRIISEKQAKAAKKKQRRNYAAARVNRLNADWTTTPYSANWTLYQDLRRLRARAREMSKNAPHFRKFLRMARSNIIGAKGILLQANARIGNRVHTTLNQKVEAAWRQWCFPENCSVSGKLGYAAAQRLMITQLIRDGEALVQFVDSGPFGVQLKFWNVDYLDEMLTQDLPNGNRIIMSVEVDQNSKPVAYHLTTPPSDLNFSRRRLREPVRIPADQILHVFIIEEEEAQARGVTWFMSGLLEGKNLEGYKGGVITSAKVAAMSFGFLSKKESDETEGFTGDEDDEGTEQAPEIDIAPAAINELADGYEFQQFDPKQPTQNHSEFHRTILHDIAAALSVNYFSLAGDMASVNYSSARVGLGEERDVWRELQSFVIDAFCRPLFNRWLRSAFASGQLDLSPRDFENVRDPKWCPRGWRYVDPQKEITASVQGLQNNLMTLSDVLAEQGIDIEEHFETIQKERQLAAQYGIELKYGTQPTTVEEKPEQGAGEDEEDDENGTKPQDDEARAYTNGRYVS